MNKYASFDAAPPPIETSTPADFLESVIANVDSAAVRRAESNIRAAEQSGEVRISGFMMMAPLPRFSAQDRLDIIDAEKKAARERLWGALVGLSLPVEEPKA